MHIGLGVGALVGRDASVDDLVGEVRRAAAARFRSAWMAQIFGYDALTFLAIAGREVPGIELGTAVVPTYPRHPVVLAGQALTTQAACGGRFVLGVGLSHQMVIEGVFGYSFDKPLQHMREYLSALRPLLHEGTVDYKGDTVKANTFMPLTIPGSSPVPILVAALGPQMLRLAGRMAEGTITWMTGPSTIASHTAPAIRAAAEEAGRPPPRVVVGLPVCVTDDVAAARQRADRTFQMYGVLPSYRAMLDREGAEGPAEVAIVGSEEEVRARVSGLADAGATDFMAAPFGSTEERERTVALLASLAS